MDFEEWQKQILRNMVNAYSEPQKCCQSEPDERQEKTKWEIKVTTDRGSKTIFFQEFSRNAALGRAKDICRREFDFFHIDSIKEVRE